MAFKPLITALSFTLIALNGYSIDATAKRNWSDLEINKKYALDRDLTLQVDAMATPGAKLRESVKLPKGLLVTLTEVTDLSEINVSLIKFVVPNCSYSNVTTEILIVNPEKTGVNDPSVGVKIEPGCSLEIFVENKDWYKKSLF